MCELLLLDASISEGNSFQQYLLLGGMLLVFYFFMIRPQQKRKKEQRAFLKEIKKGEQLVTIGGLHGKVCEVGEDTVTLETDERGTRITVSKSAVSLELNKQRGQKK